MRNSKRQTNKTRGFTLVETLVSVLLILIVVGGIFRQMQRAQSSYRVEGQKIDLTQQQREFIDQFARDLRQAGYPGPYSFGILPPVNLGDPRIGAGITAISPTSITVEGDLDNTGQVQIVTYSYDNSTTFPCPCIKRTVSAKAGGAASTYVEVQNILNPGARGIFTAYKTNGVAAPGLTLTLPAGADTKNGVYAQLHQIRSVRVTFTLQGTGNELNGKTPIQVTMTGMGRVPNND